MSVNTVLEIMPPIIGAAMRRMTELPTPELQRSGSRPAMMLHSLRRGVAGVAAPGAADVVEEMGAEGAVAEAAAAWP